MTPTTITQLTNPYAATQTLSIVQLELLILCAVVCFVAGILLAEDRTLRRIQRMLRTISVSPKKRGAYNLPPGARQLP